MSRRWSPGARCLPLDLGIETTWPPWWQRWCARGTRVRRRCVLLRSAPNAACTPAACSRIQSTGASMLRVKRGVRQQQRQAYEFTRTCTIVALAALVFCGGRHKCETCAGLLAELLPEQAPEFDAARAAEKQQQRVRGCVGAYVVACEWVCLRSMRTC